MKTFTLENEILIDGCHRTNVAPVLDEIEALRKAGDTLTLICDGEYVHRKRIDAFAKELGYVRPGATCQVFRSALPGVTVKFI